MSRSPLLVIFDYDGVIADSLEYFLGAFLDACRAHGYTQVRTREDFLRMFDSNMYEGMAAAGMPVDDHDPVLVTMSRLLKERDASYHVFPAMPAVLTKLANKCQLYVVTSNVGAIVRRHLTAEGVGCFIDILGSEHGRSKVAKIRQLIEAHRGAEVYYVGDTVGDIIEAQQAGARTVAVGWGWHSLERLNRAHPDITFERPEELSGLAERV